MRNADLPALWTAIQKLRVDQIEIVHDIVATLLNPPEMTWSSEGFATKDLVTRLGEALALHHLFSHEPFTKDKFEHAMLRALRGTGHDAVLARRGNPGHDLTVDGERWSLKTQADRGIRRNTLHISKFMELGKGRWETEEDLKGLLAQMLRHMESYDRILSLRCFRGDVDGMTRYEYELVEIPKELLLKAERGELSLVVSSSQTPKPGYCRVKSSSDLLFQLYFDGGTERKLQVKDLAKSHCRVLATWHLTAL
jgi:type II restriction enzyme